MSTTTSTARVLNSLGMFLFGAAALLAVAVVGWTQDPTNDNGEGDNGNGEGDNGNATAEADEPQSLRIAYVNIVEVLSSLPEWDSKTDELRALAKQFEQEQTELQQRIDDFEEQFQKDSQVPATVFQEYAQAKRLLERTKKAHEFELEKAYREATTEVYENVYSAIEGYTADKYDLVLGVNEREIKTGSSEEFFAKAQVRAVIVYPEQDEITNEIIKMLGGTTDDSGDNNGGGDSDDGND